MDAWHHQRDQCWEMNKTKAEFLAERHCQWRGGAEHSLPTPQHGNMKEEQHKQSLLSTARVVAPDFWETEVSPTGLVRFRSLSLLTCLQDFAFFTSTAVLVNDLDKIFRSFSGIIQYRDFTTLSSPPFKEKWGSSSFGVSQAPGRQEENH